MTARNQNTTHNESNYNNKNSDVILSLKYHEVIYVLGHSQMLTSTEL